MTKRAIVYARVSTDEQAESGFSLDAQVKAGCKYAEIHGFTVASELKDEGVSGAIAFSERPAGATAWTMLRQRQADALVVQNVDRLSRDVIDLLVVIRTLLRAGIEVHCLDLGRVTSEHDLMLMIRGAIGSDERVKIRERSMRGKRAKLARGMVVSGTPAMGYTHARDEQRRIFNFAVNEDEAAVVRLIYQWYTEGDGKNPPMTLYGIVKRLRDAGIPTRTGKGVWKVPVVSRILENPVYKGEYVYHCNETGQTFTIDIPPIVDVATWELARVQKERNRRKSKRNGKQNYLLTGIIQCGCGYGMYGTSYVRKGKRFSYYVCNSTIIYRKAERQCEERSIRADHLDAATWAALRDRLEHSETLEADMRELQRREDAEREPKTTELDAVLAMMREAEAEAATLGETLNVLTDKQKKGIVGKSLQDKVDALDERYNDLAARRDKLEAELSQRRYTDEVIAQTVSYTEGARKGLDHATDEDKRAMLDQFDARVTVTDGKPKLALWMPREVIIELAAYWQR